jgi:hypothetical protein
MSSGVETSLEFSSFLKIRDSSTSLGMTVIPRGLRCYGPTVSEEFSLLNYVGDFQWNHLLPSVVTGLQLCQHVGWLNS